MAGTWASGCADSIQDMGIEGHDLRRLCRRELRIFDSRISAKTRIVTFFSRSAINQYYMYVSSPVLGDHRCNDQRIDAFMFVLYGIREQRSDHAL